MEHNFNFLYKKLMGASVKETLSKTQPKEDVPYLTSLMEDNHIILLQALLTELEGKKIGEAKSGSSELFKKFQHDFNNLVIDFHKRLNEFSILWVDRFNIKHFLPTLKKFDWIQYREGQYFLSGTGDLGESINFYKFTVKDTVAEGVRILALFDGALSRLQEKYANLWHETTIENEQKLLPLFESSMRVKEMNELKLIRRKLPEIFREHFCSQIKDWGSLAFASEEELYQKIAKPWYKPWHNQNGFEGFMFFVEEFMWEFIKLKMEIFENKWRILFRGLNTSEKVPQVEN